MDQQSVGVISDGGQVFSLGLLRTALLAAKLKLYQSTFTPTRSSLIADFNAAEADFTGYAAATIVWSAVGIDAGNNARSTGSRAFYQATDAVTPNVIGGCWLEDSTGVLVGYYPFTAPVGIPAALSFVSVSVVIGPQGPVTADIES